jgi:hypothetical protein
MGLNCFDEWTFMGFSTSANNHFDFFQAQAATDETLRETIRRKMDELTRVDQEKILEHIEQLIQADLQRREFDNLQRPIVWTR